MNYRKGEILEETLVKEGRRKDRQKSLFFIKRSCVVALRQLSMQISPDMHHFSLQNSSEKSLAEKGD